jgi:hypothetical protein
VTPRPQTHARLVQRQNVLIGFQRQCCPPASADAKYLLTLPWRSRIPIFSSISQGAQQVLMEVQEGFVGWLWRGGQGSWKWVGWEGKVAGRAVGGKVCIGLFFSGETENSRHRTYEISLRPIYLRGRFPPPLIFGPYTHRYFTSGGYRRRPINSSLKPSVAGGICTVRQPSESLNRA